MADPITLAVMGGTAALGGFSSYSQAKAQNEATQDAARAQYKAVKTQNQQLSDQSALERLKSHNEANKIRSHLRVAAGESGIDFGGTYEALARQVDYDEAINAEIINRNLMTSTWRSNSQLQPVPGDQNPLLAALMGMMGGAQSGLSIGGSISGIMNPAPSGIIKPDPMEGYVKPKTPKSSRGGIHEY